MTKETFYTRKTLSLNEVANLLGYHKTHVWLLVVKRRLVEFLSYQNNVRRSGIELTKAAFRQLKAHLGVKKLSYEQSPA